MHAKIVLSYSDIYKVQCHAISILQKVIEPLGNILKLCWFSKAVTYIKTSPLISLHVEGGMSSNH